jgi:hypothetical protein
MELTLPLRLYARQHSCSSAAVQAPIVKFIANEAVGLDQTKDQGGLPTDGHSIRSVHLIDQPWPRHYFIDQNRAR